MVTILCDTGKCFFHVEKKNKEDMVTDTYFSCCIKTQFLTVPFIFYTAPTCDHILNALFRYLEQLAKRIPLLLLLATNKIYSLKKNNPDSNKHPAYCTPELSFNIMQVC